MTEEANRRPLEIGPRNDGGGECGAAAILFGLEQTTDQLRVLAQQHRQGRGQMLFVSSFQKRKVVPS